MPGYLLPRDLEGYLRHGEPKESRYNLRMIDWLLASEGTLIQVQHKATGEVVESFRVPTIVPASRDSGVCIHYDDGKCGVHKGSPTGCKMFNACAVGRKAYKQERMAGEFQRELMNTWVRYINKDENLTKDEELYCDLWQHLWDIGRRRENTKELTTKYQEGVR